MKKTCTIIGGGTSGLMAGALLSVSGFAVTVLEKNPTSGGGLQTFMRGGTVFETGMHVIAGHHDGLVGMLLRFLGIDNEVEILDIDRNVSDSIYVCSEGRTYDIPCGREAFAAYLSGEFPHEADNIERYLDEIFRIYNSFPLIGGGRYWPVGTHFSCTADEFIARYIKDGRLRLLFGWLNFISGTVAGRTPAYVHAIINAMYISGSGRLAGGAKRLVQALTEIICRGGGQVINGEKAAGIKISDGRAAAVTTDKGRYLTSDFYLWACGVKQLAAIAGRECFSRIFMDRLAAAEDSFSAFAVFIKLRQESMEYINHTMWLHSSLESLWQGVNGGKWPDGLMYMTPPSENQGRWADRLIILSPMSFSQVEKWAGTDMKDRPEDYRRWKDEMTGKVLRRMETVLPGIRDMAEMILASSPLSVRDWYGCSSGAIYGLSREVSNVFGTGMSARTRLENLFMCGQDLNLHGLCGVWASSLLAAAHITGNDEIINKVAQLH